MGSANENQYICNFVLTKNNNMGLIRKTARKKN